MLSVELHMHFILSKTDLENISSRKLIMLNFKQFLGWLYSIILCWHSSLIFNTAHMQGKKGRAPLGVLNGEPGYCQGDILVVLMPQERQ